jgi:hypothetical protein
MKKPPEGGLLNSNVFNSNVFPDFEGTRGCTTGRVSLSRVDNQ